MPITNSNSTSDNQRKGLLAFLRRPDEYVTQDNRPISLLHTCLWYFSTSLILVVGMAVLITLDLSPAVNSDNSIPLWGVAFFLPVAEELAFRLPLRRKRWILTVWAGAISYFLLSMALGTKVYEAEYLPWRVAGCIALTAGIWFSGWKWLRRIRFGWYFYLLAIAFGCAHLTNNFSDGCMTAGTAAFFILYAVYQTLGGLILGYARLKHGFLLCVLLHILTNLPAAL